eukprot:SAG25_NODE_9394_length_374_cov_0.749091_1_plen_26_part_10
MQISRNVPNLANGAIVVVATSTSAAV